MREARRAIEDAKDEAYNEINPLKEEITSLRDELKHAEEQLMDYQKDSDILKGLFGSGVIDIDRNPI